ncbi:LLM class F420-dependent oxidoreductase [Nonomuraea sp. NPDC005650]|uniref:LLM class F420-dependent oxidoreductase n=1 Tax=Nonomuraea sp. NPDC005650 TaxID=3157045 RepID=UPI0033AED122
MELTGVGVWSMHLGFGDPGEITEAAAELEELGFSAVWIPEGGGAAFDRIGRLLSATRRMVIATGILNVWMHTPAETAAAYARLSAGGRFLLGLGVSHAMVVDGAEPGRYRRPLAAMTTFLDGLDTAETPVPVEGRVLAALGPKMLEVAAQRARGVHPYLVTPEHTYRAREAVGADALVLPEQTAILCANRDEARAVATDWLQLYLSLPNYANSLRRLGFTDDDLATTSDRLFDAVIAWGDEQAVMRRVAEHRAAGADHVAVQILTPDPLSPNSAFPRAQWRRLGAALGSE